MAKGRSKGRIAESSATYRLRKRQQKARKTRPSSAKKKRLTPLERKATEISILALRHHYGLPGPKHFIDFLKARPYLNTQRGSVYPNPRERKHALLKVLGKSKLETQIAEINDWFRVITRPIANDKNN